MGTLKEALHSMGIVSERQFREAEAEAEMAAESTAARSAKPAKEKEKRLAILRETSSPDTFRREARKILLLSPDLVQELLNIAHGQGMHKKKDKGGGRLIANLYQVKEALRQGGLSDDMKKSIVDKLFSKK